jgi:hypothetical protein
MSDPITKWPEQPFERDRSVPEAGEGHAKIQWKGTDVCMDIRCRCGAHGHIDAGFAYFYKCLACGLTFAVGQTVRLYPLDPTYAASRAMKGMTPVVDEDLVELAIPIETVHLQVEPIGTPSEACHARCNAAIDDPLNQLAVDLAFVTCAGCRAAVEGMLP